MCNNRTDEKETAQELAEIMIVSADINEMGCTDDSCFLIYGLIRDCGYKVKKLLSAACTERDQSTIQPPIMKHCRQ